MCVCVQVQTCLYLLCTYMQVLKNNARVSIYVHVFAFVACVCMYVHVCAVAGGVYVCVFRCVFVVHVCVGVCKCRRFVEQVCDVSGEVVCLLTCRLKMALCSSVRSWTAFLWTDR